MEEAYKLGVLDALQHMQLYIEDYVWCMSPIDNQDMYNTLRRILLGERDDY